MKIGTSEFALLLRTMEDAGIGSTLNRIINVGNREELNMEPLNPWKDIASLFNYKSFTRHPVKGNINGVIPHQTSDIDPTVVVSERTPDVFKAK